MPNREELPDGWSWSWGSRRQSSQATVPPSTLRTSIHHAPPDPPTAALASSDLRPNTTAKDVSAGAAAAANPAVQAAPAWFENAMAQLNKKLDEQNDAIHKKLDAAFKDINKRIDEQQGAIERLRYSVAALSGDEFLKLLGIKQGNEAGDESGANEQMPWALTKVEKKNYDNIFKSWDTQNTGFIDGPTGIEVFGASGLTNDVLGRIWNLADRNNRGKLNVQEFHIAMGLIYRRLNGMVVPMQLPPDLIPEERAVDLILFTIEDLEGGIKDKSRTTEVEEVVPAA